MFSCVDANGSERKPAVIAKPRAVTLFHPGGKDPRDAQERDLRVPFLVEDELRRPRCGSTSNPSAAHPRPTLDKGV